MGGIGFVSIFLWFFLSLLAADIAANKGRSGLFVFLASMLLSPLIGLLLAIVQNPDQLALDRKEIRSGRLKRCPYCAELIKSKAILCSHCRTEMPKLKTDLLKF